MALEMALASQYLGGKENSMRITKGERTFYILNNVFMLLICAVMLYPMLYVLGHSLMSDAERVQNPLQLFPTRIDWTGYQYIITASNVWNSYLVTILRTVIGTVLNVSFTALMAYPLSRKHYPARKVLTVLVTFTMWFSGGMVANFLLIRALNLTNNFWVYIFPHLIDPFYLIILRNFFMQIPDSLEESARIDGANDFVILFRIVLPLSLASIATISLFYAIFHWNTWWDAMLYVTKDRTLWPIQYLLQQLIASANVFDLSASSSAVRPPAEAIRMACIVVAVIPILCVYPFVQKYFVKGVLVGSIKG